ASATTAGRRSRRATRTAPTTRPSCAPPPSARSRPASCAPRRSMRWSATAARSTTASWPTTRATAVANICSAGDDSGALGRVVMVSVTPSGAALGARLSDLDLNRLDDAMFAAIEGALHRYGVIALTDQRIDEDVMVAFSRRFGKLEINVTSAFRHAKHPE